jgi:hypothetical protein
MGVAGVMVAAGTAGGNGVAGATVTVGAAVDMAAVTGVGMVVDVPGVPQALNTMTSAPIANRVNRSRCRPYARAAVDAGVELMGWWMLGFMDGTPTVSLIQDT